MQVSRRLRLTISLICHFAVGRGGGGGGGGGGGLSEADLERLHEGNPSLVPDEKSGFCQKYTGNVCSKYIGNNVQGTEYIFLLEMKQG